MSASTWMSFPIQVKMRFSPRTQNHMSLYVIILSASGEQINCSNGQPRQKLMDCRHEHQQSLPRGAGSTCPSGYRRQQVAQPNPTCCHRCSAHLRGQLIRMKRASAPLPQTT